MSRYNRNNRRAGEDIRILLGVGTAILAFATGAIRFANMVYKSEVTRDGSNRIVKAKTTKPLTGLVKRTNEIVRTVFGAAPKPEDVLKE